jgi:hypothetical protein
VDKWEALRQTLLVNKEVLELTLVDRDHAPATEGGVAMLGYVLRVMDLLEEDLRGKDSDD